MATVFTATGQEVATNASSVIPNGINLYVISSTDTVSINTFNLGRSSAKLEAVHFSQQKMEIDND